MNRLAFFLALTLPAVASAHDAWVQTNTNVVRTGDAIHVDLMVGNHGKTLEIIDPDGKPFDLKDRLVDTGSAPKEGFLSARFVPKKPGLYVVAHKSDEVVTSASERSIKGAKTCFIASPTLDRVAKENPGFDRPVGHDLELIPVLSPVFPMGPGSVVRVRLLYRGKPAVGERVTFIPRGTTLKPGLDDRFEQATDSQGEAEFEPTEGNYYRLAAHKVEPKQSGTLGGKPYDSTRYEATLSIYVPQTCPCCGAEEG